MLPPIRMDQSTHCVTHNRYGCDHNKDNAADDNNALRPRTHADSFTTEVHYIWPVTNLVHEDLSALKLHTFIYLPIYRMVGEMNAEPVMSA